VVETSGDAQLLSLAVDLLNPCGKLALLTGGSGTDLPGGGQVLSVICWPPANMMLVAEEQKRT
jgi:hypothetical protein